MCCESVFLSNAMYRVKHIFVLADNLAHLILTSCFRDIPTLKEVFHPSAKEIQYKRPQKTTRAEPAFSSYCFWVNTGMPYWEVHFIKDLRIRSTRLQQTYIGNKGNP